MEPESDSGLLEAKVKIKTWEKQFVGLNLRVPESADVKVAPADVRAAYALYFQYKKRQSEAKATPKRTPGQDEVWGDQFNVKQREAGRKVSSAQDRFAEKMKQKVLSGGSPVWRTGLGRRTLGSSGDHRTATGVDTGDRQDDNSTPPSTTTTSDGSYSIASTTGNADSTSLGEADSVPKTQPTTTGPATQEQDTAWISNSPGPVRLLIGSPVKDRKVSLHRPVFMNRSLNADWLERNANISSITSDGPAKDSNSSILSIASAPLSITPSTDGVRIKLSQIENFAKEANSAAPEVEKAIKIAKNAISLSQNAVSEDVSTTKPSVRASIVSFEDEFTKEMQGRSDVANVRKMKTHHKFNMNTPRDEHNLTEETPNEAMSKSHTQPEDSYNEDNVTEAEPPASARRARSKKYDHNESPIEQASHLVRANSPEAPKGSPAPRSILDPYLFHQQEAEQDQAVNQAARQLYPKDTIRSADAADDDVKELRKKGVRVNARAKRETEPKPKAGKSTAKKKTSEGAGGPGRGRKRGRAANGESDVEQAPEQTKEKKGYMGAEGGSEDTDMDAAAKRAKKMAPSDDYHEDCSTRIELRTKPTTSLERRMANGTLNENFVKANLRKKTYSRGLKKFNFKKYKFEQWKQAKGGFTGKSGYRGGQGGGPPQDNEARMKKMQCFKCGGFGHWAKYCFSKPKSAEADDANDEPDEVHIPTLEEAAALAMGIKTPLVTTQQAELPASTQDSTASSSGEGLATSTENRTSVNVNDKVDPGASSHSLAISDDEVEELMSQIPLEQNRPATSADSEDVDRPDEVDNRCKVIKPLKDMESTEIRSYLMELGFDEFRPGQETVIKRILKGQSTLMVSSTGSGKSLCYQLPAYIYATKMACVTLVVSPLISLMEDQVTGLPGKLKAVFLHSGMPQPQRAKNLELIKEGQVHAVLVSPEAVVAAGQGGSLLAGLPPIAFACIDEAHCLSEWSHNFRPSYLQLHTTLRDRLGVGCVLALTATATKSTCSDIAKHLDIAKDGIVGLFRLPDNLVLTASKEVDRDRALIDLLKSDRFSSCSSIIIYTTRRDETERLAALIRTSMQNKLRSAEELAAMKRQRNKVRDVLRWDAEAYHAGLTPAKRKSVQNKFMKGQIRVVVATVAFGMGIDKADIRAIIHYNMPKSFENYVQEAGRAGRDGLRSDCHLFLEFKNQDRNEIKRHIFADSTDRSVLRRFLEKLFEPMARLKEAMAKLPRFEVALNIEQMIEYLDMKEENILTLMCFLESHPNKFAQLKQRVYGTATVKCYGGPSQLASLVKTSPPLAAALALKKKFGELKDDKILQASTLSFPVVEVATFMGWDSKLVKRDLKNLEWDSSRVAFGGKHRKTGVMVEFSDLCFHLYVSSDLGSLDQNEVLEYLNERVQQQEALQLDRLAKVFSSFQHVALKSGEGVDEVDISRSDELKRIIENYFNEKPLGIKIDEDFNKEASDESLDLDCVRSDIRSLIHSQPDQTFTGRAVARIMHGIASPNYPAQVWGRLRRVWRSHLEVDFPRLVRLANQEIIQWRLGSGA